MPGFLREEHGHFRINCRAAKWKTGKIHDMYHACGLPDYLNDADFVIETETNLLLVEYKNASIPEAVAHAKEGQEYNPLERTKFQKIVRKYYDSLHYLRLVGNEKPVHFVFVVEYPKGDATSRRALRNRLKDSLPFELQKRFNQGVQLIKEVAVVNMAEWNAHNIYGRFQWSQCRRRGHSRKRTKGPFGC